MKKRFVAALGSALTACLMAFVPHDAAAFIAGDVEIGAQLGKNGVVPYLAVFINDDLSFGGSAFFESGDIESVDYTTLGFDLLARYNIELGRTSPNIPFVEGGFRYVSEDIEGETTKSRKFIVGGGVRYRLYENVYSNVTLGYSAGKVEDADTSAFTFSAGISILL